MESENATLNGCKSKLIIHSLTNEMNRLTKDTIMNQDISAMYRWSKFIKNNKSSEIVSV